MSRYVGMDGIISKISIGARLSDDELRWAIGFYADMDEGLALLGPHFFLAWSPCAFILNELKGFARSRGLKVNSDESV